MTVELIGLAVLMAAVTYPSRALPMLVPGIDRLPAAATEYLRLVGPATLAALAASGANIVFDEAQRPAIQDVPLVLGIVACLAVMVVRRNLLAGLVAAVALVAGLRFLGLG